MVIAEGLGGPRSHPAEMQKLQNADLFFRSAPFAKSTVSSRYSVGRENQVKKLNPTVTPVQLSDFCFRLLPAALCHLSISPNKESP